MITKISCTYAMRNLHQEKSLRDHKSSGWVRYGHKDGHSRHCRRFPPPRLQARNPGLEPRSRSPDAHEAVEAVSFLSLSLVPTLPLCYNGNSAEI